MEFANAVLDTLYRLNPCVTRTIVRKGFNVCVYSAVEEGLLIKAGYDLQTLTCGNYNDMEDTFIFSANTVCKEISELKLIKMAYRQLWTYERFKKYLKNFSYDDLVDVWLNFYGKTLSKYVAELYILSVLVNVDEEHKPTKYIEIPYFWESVGVISGLLVAFYIILHRRRCYR